MPSIHRKITISYSAMAAVIAALALFAFLDHLYLERRVHEGVVVQDFKDATLEMRRYEKNLFLYEDRDTAPELTAFLRRASDILGRERLDLRSLAPGDDLDALQAELSRYAVLVDRYGNLDGEAPALQEAIRTVGHRISSSAEQLARRERHTLAQAVIRSQWALALSFLLVVLAVVLVGRGLSKAVMQPLRELVHDLAPIAEGQLDRLSARSRDRELVTFTQAINHMLDELELRRRRLLQSEKLAALGTLAAGVAHEINNPLSNISSSAQLLAEELEGTEQASLKAWAGQIVDDEPVAVNNLSYALVKSGHQVVTRTSGAGALEALDGEPFDVVLTDLRMERVDGMMVLRRALDRDPDQAVVIITGHATLPSAVEAIKAGAYDYLEKPFRLEEVRAVVAKAAELVRLRRENRDLRKRVGAVGNADLRLITKNMAMLRLLQTAREVAPTDSNVLILGESGTGKELVARQLHAHSRRAAGPFVAVNCGAFQEELLANELFGHEKGAYTGAAEARPGLIEAAHGGTLFLDEIAEMSPPMQVKLLRVIQEREVVRLGSVKPRPVDVRFVAATLRDLRAEVAAGRFRQDMYYRLDVVSLTLPPLAERRDDIPLLAFYFLRKHALRMDKPVQDIDPEAMALLGEYDYPGNVRELENLIERGVALSRGSVLTARALPPVVAEKAIHVIREKGGRLPTLEEREGDYIRWVLDQSAGNRTRAARVLGIDRVSLWRKLKRLGLADSEGGKD